MTIRGLTHSSVMAGPGIGCGLRLFYASRKRQRTRPDGEARELVRRKSLGDVVVVAKRLQEIRRAVGRRVEQGVPDNRALTRRPMAVGKAVQVLDMHKLKQIARIAQESRHLWRAQESRELLDDLRIDRPPSKSGAWLELAALSACIA